MTNDATRASDSALPNDPILAAIEAYYAGNAAYENHPITRTLGYSDEEEAAAIAETYGGADAVLLEWKVPAQSFDGALAALQLARYEAVDMGLSASRVVDNMLDAAIAFFEQKGGLT